VARIEEDGTERVIGSSIFALVEVRDQRYQVALVTSYEPLARQINSLYRTLIKHAKKTSSSTVQSRLFMTMPKNIREKCYHVLPKKFDGKYTLMPTPYHLVRIVLDIQ
jgi:hypothetical protein